MTKQSSTLADRPISIRIPINVLAFIDSQPGTRTRTILGAVQEKMVPRQDPRIDEIEIRLDAIESKLNDQKSDIEEVKKSLELILEMLQYATST